MELNENALNRNVSTASLLKYAMPTILSNIFMNVYSIVDQLFVLNLLGTDALSAVSIAEPFLAVALAIGTIDRYWRLRSGIKSDGRRTGTESPPKFFIFYAV